MQRVKWLAMRGVSWKITLSLHKSVIEIVPR